MSKSQENYFKTLSEKQKRLRNKSENNETIYSRYKINYKKTSNDIFSGYVKKQMQKSTLLES